MHWRHRRRRFKRRRRGGSRKNRIRPVNKSSDPLDVFKESYVAQEGESLISEILRSYAGADWLQPRHPLKAAHEAFERLQRKHQRFAADWRRVVQHYERAIQPLLQFGPPIERLTRPWRIFVVDAMVFETA